MSLVTTDAIVLQAFAYGDTSRIVRLLTRSAGVQSAIARGAARPRSRFSMLEPFTEGTASLYLRTSRELQTLGGFELSRSRQSLGRDLLRFGGASLLAELVMRTASEEPQADLYDAVTVGLDRLTQAPAELLEVTVLAVIWRVIAVLGFEPALDQCVSCGREMAEGDAATFDYSAGGLRCDDCAAGAPGRPIPPHARTALQAFCRGEPVAVDITEGHWRLLGRYLEHHLLEGTQLRSLQFLGTTLGVG